MDSWKRLRMILAKKPIFFVEISGIYILLVILCKWFLTPTLNTVWFFVGTGIGTYLIDMAEAFVDIKPSPFRGPVFLYGFLITSFFVVSSSGSFLASGLVLALFVTLLLRLAGELHARIISVIQKLPGTFVLSLAVFILETVLFIRQYPA